MTCTKNIPQANTQGRTPCDTTAQTPQKSQSDELARNLSDSPDSSPGICKITAAAPKSLGSAAVQRKAAPLKIDGFTAAAVLRSLAKEWRIYRPLTRQKYGFLVVIRPDVCGGWYAFVWAGLPDVAETHRGTTGSRVIIDLAKREFVEAPGE